MQRASAHAPIVALLASMLSTPALAQFVEPAAQALYQLTDPTGGAFGWGVADMADIDADGAREIITGAPTNNSGGTRAGKAYLFSGRTGGTLREITGTVPNEQLGFSYADAFDVDADGVHDFVVGAPAPGVATLPGRAFVYSGATGAVIRTFVGAANGDQAGYAVAGVGDVNQDGHADFAVGAPFNDTGSANAGRVYIVSGLDGSILRTLDAPAGGKFGSGLGSAARDLDGDGIGDLVVGAMDAGGGPGRAYVYSLRTGALLWTLAPTTGSAFGQFFTALIGDVNADGMDDIYVGDYAVARAHVFSGSSGLLLHQFVGPAGSGMGCGRGAGDVDNDGHEDLCIGLYTSSIGAPGAGRVEIYSGRDYSLLRSITSTVSAGNLGFDAVGMGDVDGDCFTDFLLSAASGNRIYVVKGLEARRKSDLNDDGFSDAIDYDLFISAWLTSDPAADFNSDGFTDALDYDLFIAAFLAGC